MTGMLSVNIFDRLEKSSVMLSNNNDLPLRILCPLIPECFQGYFDEAIPQVSRCRSDDGDLLARDHHRHDSFPHQRGDTESYRALIVYLDCSWWWAFLLFRKVFQLPIPLPLRYITYHSDEVTRHHCDRIFEYTSPR